MASGAAANSKNVGAGNYVAAVMLQDGVGGRASDYQLPTLGNATAPVTITPKALAAGSATAVSKVYDGSTATAINVGPLSGLAGSETLVVTAVGTLASKNAGNTTATAAYTLADGASGGLAGNYTLANTTGLAATVTPKALAIAGTTAGNKVYDGTAAATIALGTLSGFVGAETVTATATGSFDSTHAGSRTATAAYTLANGANGGLTGNYSLANTTGLAATITPKTTTLSATKIYDGSTALGSVIVATGISGESLGASGAAANSKNVGAGNYVAAVTLQDGVGGRASDYQLPTLGNATAPVTITPKALTASGATVANKVYDGTTAASIAQGTLSGFVGSETVSATVTGAFDSRNAGRRTVNATYVLSNGGSGGLAGNYVLASTSSLEATITPKPLGIIGLSVPNRYADNNTAPVFEGVAKPDPTQLVTRLENGASITDTVSVAGTPTGTFSSLETLKPLTVTITPGSLTLAGADGANYLPTLPQLTTALLPRDLRALVAAIGTSSGSYTNKLGGITFGNGSNTLWTQPWTSGSMEDLVRRIRNGDITVQNALRSEQFKAINKTLTIHMSYACPRCTFTLDDWAKQLGSIKKN